MAAQFYFTKHALIEMDNDAISMDDVKKIILSPLWKDEIKNILIKVKPEFVERLLK